MASNTRASRSASRYSSPAHALSADSSAPGPLEVSKSSANEGAREREFMRGWLEPSVQRKPSYQQAGLMRYGVVENMAPLGTLPKVKKNAGGGDSTTRPVPRIILKPSGAAKKKQQQPKTVATAPASPPESPLYPPVDDAEGQAPLVLGPIKDEDPNDDEYDPKGGARARSRRTRRVTAPVERTQIQSDAKQPITQRERRRSSAAGTKNLSPQQLHHAVRPDSESLGFTDKVVTTAVEEALKHYRYPTAWALRSLYDEKHGEPEFDAMVEDVFCQTTDEETLNEFAKLVEKRKREGKKDNKACYYFVPPSTNSRFTPHKPKPAPYGHLLHKDFDDMSYGEEEEEDDEDEDETQQRQEENKMRAAKRAKTSHDAKVGSHDGAGRAGPSALDESTDGAAPTTPTSRKRARRGSASSDSSLSSVMSMSSPEMRMSLASRRQEAGDRGVVGSGKRAGAYGAKSTGAKGEGGYRAQPITGSDPEPVASSKLNANASSDFKASRSLSPQFSQPQPQQSQPPHSPRTTRPGATRSHNKPPAGDDSSMPGRLSASELFPNLSVGKTKTRARTETETESTGADSPPLAVNANPRSALDVEAHMPRDEDDSFWDRRRHARRVTGSVDNAKQSSVREGIREATPLRTTRKTRQSLVASAVTTRATRSASKRPGDDVDRNLSPIPFALAGVRDGASRSVSRAATPSSQRPAKKQKTGLRVKSSPVKKKGGAAGVPRSQGEATPSANGSLPKDPTTDNDEYCSACGNTGDVVCCDGCPRSFHFECVDMVQSDNLPDDWYCNECLIRRFPSRVPVHKGIFGGALNNLEKSIPRAFSLPKRVQNRFEGVKAGADGDYDEVVSRTAKKRNGYDELPDFFKQREDGQAVLCHSCQKPSTEIRSIIPCSVCTLYWHIDCLDPPLAVPPVLKTWRCPAHVDDVLIDVPGLAPAHRFRKVKNSQAISPAIWRGLKNNGHIEIDWADEPDEQNESGWHDYRSFGRTYKLSAKGVVLDFIEQMRLKGAGYGPRQDEQRVVPCTATTAQVQDQPGEPLRGSALERNMDEVQVSLNLLRMQQKRSEGIDLLVSALLTTADQGVLSLMANANANTLASGATLTEEDKLGLRATLTQMDAMSARIRQLLGEDTKAKAPSEPVPHVGDDELPLPSGSIDSAPPPVTEPTPPSTVDHEGCMELD